MPRRLPRSKSECHLQNHILGLMIRCLKDFHSYFIGFKKIKFMKNISIFTVGLILISAPFLVLESARADDDRDATPEEEAQVMEVLQQDDCTVVDDVDYVQDVGFKADDVQCNDGKEYDVYLDEDFNIISRQEDLD